jgi:hypothetical protein
MSCMKFQVDIWLRGDHRTTTKAIGPVPREPSRWTDDDIVAVLEAMLRALERAKDPGVSPDRPVSLRGFRWIVRLFEIGGVDIALERSLGVVIAAGPFDVAESVLSAKIERVMGAQRTAAQTVH